MQYLIITLVTSLAGFIQGITGFGSGIVMMMVLPVYYAVIQAAGISNAISIFLNGMMAYRYKDKINFKKVVFPSILFLICSTCSTYLGMNIDQVLVKKIFGIFLVVLSIYFIYFSKNQRKELSTFVSLSCIVISGICNGLFGIGGPLMVVYFLNQMDDMNEYLGTMQAFFLINNTIITGVRFYSGILTFEHFPIILVGVIGILIGLKFANKILDKVDGNFIKKVTYFTLGISGVLNII